MLLHLNEMKKIYSPCLVSVVHLTCFVVFVGFSGVCRSFLLAKSRLDTAVSKDLGRQTVFSPKFKSAAQFFPSIKRRIVHLSPFPSAYKQNLQTFHSNSKDFYLTTGAFNFPTPQQHERPLLHDKCDLPGGCTVKNFRQKYNGDLRWLLVKML